MRTNTNLQARRNLNDNETVGIGLKVRTGMKAGIGDVNDKR
jgi:hypothetical protein